MALEQWEVDLRNQLLGIQKDVVDSKPEKEPLKKEPIDKSFYLSFYIFILIALFFALDFKIDFLSKIFQNSPKVEKKEEIIKEEPQVIQNVLETEKIAEIMEKIRKQDEKLFVLGIVVNENAVVLKNNLSKKDVLIIEKDWKLQNYPKYLKMSEKDKEYFNGVKKN
jgi:hypothetical protein